jgi:aryl-alcohol dehydrogenase-like predicted oxidoreductase
VLRTRRLGSTGPDITLLGLGTWAVGGPYEFGWGPVDDNESVAAIRYGVESGINWIDTAPVYGLGHSEEVVGRAVEPFRVGEEVLVFTKCGRNYYGPSNKISSDLRPSTIRRECEESLKRLNVDRIDLFQFHWPDPTTGASIEDSWTTMLELIQQGKVRWGGVSNFETALLDRCESIRHVDSVQPPLSLINRAALDDVVPWSREHGVGVIVYAPLASGLLTGKFDERAVDALAPDDWRRRAPHFQEPALSRNLLLVERLRPLAARLGMSLSALAVAWTLAVPGVTGAIVGARRAEQVDGWIGGGREELPEEALRQIELAIKETEADATNG